MSKYNVGDVVKLRDDLEVGKEYGRINFATKMEELKNKPVEIFYRGFQGDYTVQKGWIINDEMIEGLWEECKEKQDKLKLIDVLNMIARGELKEGTKVICNNSTFEYRKLHKDSGRNTLDLYSKNNTSLINATYLTPVLSFEVELIEPDHFADVGKMEKIEELKYDDFWEWDAYSAGEDEEEFVGTEMAIKMIFNKLNEVIRKINKE